MATAGQRKCLCCGVFFTPDYRNRRHQRYCAEPACRLASKAGSQAAWLAKPANRDYFGGPVHVARVQAWRAAHPGYSRGKHSSERPRSTDSSTATSTCQGQTSCNGGSAAPAALQDPCTPSEPLLTGLIAHLFHLTLQEDIVLTTRQLVKLGHDVMKRGTGGELESIQAGVAARAAAPGAAAVQLG